MSIKQKAHILAATIVTLASGIIYWLSITMAKPISLTLFLSAILLLACSVAMVAIATRATGKQVTILLEDINLDLMALGVMVVSALLVVVFASVAPMVGAGFFALFTMCATTQLGVLIGLRGRR
ncbi:hypothetical protein [Galliscardovia ingluviei]|nr:hypothetical protein [Galliscardovia ingluviei]